MQNALEHALGGLSLRDFESGGVRVTHSVPGRLGPHVAATDIIKATTKTTQQNASQQWLRLKSDHPETTSGTCSFRFPGQRGLAAEVVDIPTALQIIMLLPGRAAAALRLKASVLLVRFLGGDLSLIAEIYDMNALQEHLREHWPEHPLVRFREAVEAAAVPARAAEGAVQHMDAEQLVRACSDVLPQLVEHLVPVCVSKFQGALEKIWAAQERSQRDMLEKMLQAVLAQQLGASPQRPIVNVNCSARRAL